MTAKLPVQVKDPLVAERLGFEPEVVAAGDEPFFIDGPVTARVAVLPPSTPPDGRRVHTALSRDIVGHEAA